MSDEHEAMVASCNNTSQLRHVGEKKPEIIPAISDSIAPVKLLLSNVLQWLKLHDKQFRVFSAATEDDLKELWSELDSVDKSLEYGGQYRKKCLESHPDLVNFLSHCCKSRHYSFAIKKCGDPSCSICKPVRMSREMFEKLTYLSDPVPGQDGHYLSFAEVYSSPTTEEHRPSLQARKGWQKSLPFVASVQHEKNANCMFQCEECQMWRLVYSKYKLSAQERQTLDNAMLWRTIRTVVVPSYLNLA